MPLFEKKSWIFNLLVPFYLPLTIKRAQRMDYCFDYDWYSIIARIVYKAESFADKSQYAFRNHPKNGNPRAFYNNVTIFVLREGWQNDAHFYFTALINSKWRKIQWLKLCQSREVISSRGPRRYVDQLASEWKSEQNLLSRTLWEGEMFSDSYWRGLERV